MLCDSLVVVHLVAHLYSMFFLIYLISSSVFMGGVPGFVTLVSQRADRKIRLASRRRSWIFRKPEMPKLNDFNLWHRRLSRSRKPSVEDR